MAFGKVDAGKGVQIVGFGAVAGIAVLLGAVTEIADVANGQYVALLFESGSYCPGFLPLRWSGAGKEMIGEEVDQHQQPEDEVEGEGPPMSPPEKGCQQYQRCGDKADGLVVPQSDAPDER